MIAITPELEQDIGEMSSILFILHEADREILMLNARAFKARQVIIDKRNLETKKLQEN